MSALDVIQSEHRSMWRVAVALDALARELGGEEESRALEALRGLLVYLDSYIDTLHHPKEDRHLFPFILRQAPELAASIEALTVEHREGPEKRLALGRTIDAYALRAGTSRETLIREIGEFTESIRAHIRLEETRVLPAARQARQHGDWADIEAAFANHDDPLFGERVVKEFEQLRARIVAAAPEPIGLGATGSETAAGDPVEDALLAIAGLGCRYGRITALDGIDIAIRSGQLVALVGSNGAGKTTLLRCISGVLPMVSGQITFKGRDISRSAPHARVEMGISQVPEGRQVFSAMSIEENLRLGAYTRRRQDFGDDLERMYGLFPILKEKRRLPAGALSGGQQQMLAMARALMARPRVLLLDEPSMGLAPLLVEEIFRVIRTLKEQGVTIFLVEQNAHAALQLADFGYVLETGRIVLAGTGESLLRDENVQRAYLGM